MNEEIYKDLHVSSAINELKIILRNWKGEGIIEYQVFQSHEIYRIEYQYSFDILKKRISEKHKLSSSILEYLISESQHLIDIDTKNNTRIEFSILELRNILASGILGQEFRLNDVINSLLFLGETKVIELLDGFAVYYSALTVEKLEKNERKRYTADDYEDLQKYYQNRIEQIHIVGEYAEKVIENEEAALTFVDDYFTLDYSVFIQKYFPKRKTEIVRPITLSKFNQLINDLSVEQMEVITDNKSGSIMITAGPGSGKTRVLVHKIASLILMEDIKPEQFLMFAFSRIASMELKDRLKYFLSNLAHSLDIFTFHGFCFHMFGYLGNLEKSENIIKTAIREIKNGNLSDEIITSKSILIIDEFQDVGSDEAELIDLIIERADSIRTIVVGDDDQNIYEFRGSDIQNFRRFTSKYNSKSINLLTNYRSTKNLVDFSNRFIVQVTDRIKNEPLKAYRKELGTILIQEYKHANIYHPVCNQIAIENPTGSTGVLTHTNEEAALLQCLLESRGIKSRLIISDNQFNVSDILEVRTFSYFLGNRENDAFGVLEEDFWYQCKDKIFSMYPNSSTLSLLKEQFTLFEKVYPQKTLSEWNSFINEIKIEDTYIPEKNSILITTMHKSKGKEFDNVFIMLRNYNADTDAQKRVLYMAITRAKNTLSIHTNTRQFGNYSDILNFTYSHNETIYEEPHEILIQLGHRDVYLSGFKYKSRQEIIKSLISGDSLFLGPKANTLYTKGGLEVLNFSKSFSALLGKKWYSKGYSIKGSLSQFILLWKDALDDTECRIVLPNLRLKRMGTTPTFMIDR